MNNNSSKKKIETAQNAYNSKQLEKFKKKFTPHQLPNTLIELIKFDDSLAENNYYSQSFYLNDDNEEEFFETWLDSDATDDEKRREYAKNMIIFANADGTGGAYAMWIQEGNTDLEKAPIISYGSEGEITVVANNLKDLIKILSFGAEGMEGSFYHYIDDEDEDPDYNFYDEFVDARPNFLKFRKWMKETLGIEPVDIECLKKGECEESEEIEKLVKKAQKKHKKVFDKWQYQFYPNPEDEKKAYEAKKQKEFEKKKKELLSKIENNPTADLYFQLAENETTPEDVDYKQRDAYFEKALEIDPNHIKTLEKYADDCEYSKPKRAIELYTKLIEIHNDPKSFYDKIAYAYRQDGKRIKALEWYMKDVITKPNEWAEYSQGYIVDICENLKSKDAIKILEETLKHGHNKGTYKVLYQEHFKKRDYSKASEYAIQYINHSDEQGHNYVTIAEKFFKKKVYEEAKKVFKCIDLEDYYVSELQILNYIGLCNLNLKKYEEAFDAFKKGYFLNKEEKAIHQNIYIVGANFYQLENYTKAKEAFEFCLDNFECDKENINKLLNVIDQKI